MFPEGQPVTVIRTETGRHGDALPEPPEHTVEDCAWHPRTTTEDDDRGNTVVIGLTLYAPYGADITATDRIRLPDGTEHTVEGEPGNWESPFSGWQAGMQVALQRVRG